MNNLLVRLLQLVLPRRYWYRRFYLRSAHWCGFRERIGKARKWHCEAEGCREWGRHLDVHHMVYNLWHEKPKEVKVLCRRHHEMEHQ